MQKNKKEVKLVIFEDDDGEVKDRAAVILEENAIWIKLKLWNLKENKVIDSPAFVVPIHRIRKIKDLISTLFVDSITFEVMQ